MTVVISRGSKKAMGVLRPRRYYKLCGIILVTSNSPLSVNSQGYSERRQLIYFLRLLFRRRFVFSQVQLKSFSRRNVNMISHNSRGVTSLTYLC
jgi:hypothetical protein